MHISKLQIYYKMHRMKKDTHHFNNVVTFGKTLDLVGSMVKDFNILSIFIQFKKTVLIWNYILS